MNHNPATYIIPASQWCRGKVQQFHIYAHVNQSTPPHNVLMIKKKEKNPATSTYRKHADTNSCWLANTLLDGWSDPESEDQAPCCSFQQQTQERVEQAFFLYLRLCLNLTQLKKKGNSREIQEAFFLSLWKKESQIKPVSFYPGDPERCELNPASLVKQKRKRQGRAQLTDHFVKNI